MKERYAHYDLHTIEVVELDFENNTTEVRVYNATGVEYLKQYDSVEVGKHIIEGGDDFRRMDV